MIIIEGAPLQSQEELKEICNQIVQGANFGLVQGKAWKLVYIKDAEEKVSKK